MPVTKTERKDLFVVQVQDSPDLYADDDEELVDGQAPWEDADNYVTLEAAQENVASREARLRRDWERRVSGPTTRRITLNLTRENLERELQRARDRHARHFSSLDENYKRPEYPKYRIIKRSIIKRSFVDEEVVVSQ
jgi:hypothetical protein